VPRCNSRRSQGVRVYVPEVWHPRRNHHFASRYQLLADKDEMARRPGFVNFAHEMTPSDMVHLRVLPGGLSWRAVSSFVSYLVSRSTLSALPRELVGGLRIRPTCPLPPSVKNALFQGMQICFPDLNVSPRSRDLALPDNTAVVEPSWMCIYTKKVWEEDGGVWWDFNNKAMQANVTGLAYSKMWLKLKADAETARWTVVYEVAGVSSRRLVRSDLLTCLADPCACSRSVDEHGSCVRRTWC
jgi:hypothetical protein